jgi:hypothetical protein
MSKAKNTEIARSETIRKIGRTTFIVSSVYAEGSRNDIASTIARLIQNDAISKVAANNAKSA